MSKRTIFQISGYAAGLSAIALITFLYFYPIFLVKTTTVVLTFLLAILIASTLWGLGVSAAMSVAAALCVDYFFLPPVGTFNINDPEDWVTLVSFLVTAVIGSELSARARRQADQATRQRIEVNRLYKFSQRLLDARNPLDLLENIPPQIVELFEVSSAALYSSGQDAYYASGLQLPELDFTHLKAMQESANFDAAGDQKIICCPVRVGAQTLGCFGISGSTVSQGTLWAITTLIAVAMDRMNAIELLGKNEAARESERLKSVLLDAIAHDFKTPLTSIKAAATSLLEDLEFDKRQRGELLIVIDEECDRINRVIGQAIEMAQLDAGAVKLQPAPHSVSELIAVAIEDCGNVRSTRPIRTQAERPDMRVRCDLYWSRKVLIHLIQNADLYSTPGEPITITAESKNGFVYFHVADVGPGIEKEEREQIFAKFFRGKGQRHRVPGTGMGLSVAKAIVEGHGGKLEVASAVGRGSVFTFSLPSES